MPVVINDFDVVTEKTPEQMNEPDPMAGEERGRPTPLEIRDMVRHELERLWRVRAL